MSRPIVTPQEIYPVGWNPTVVRTVFSRIRSLTVNQDMGFNDDGGPRYSLDQWIDDNRVYRWLQPVIIATPQEEALREHTSRIMMTAAINNGGVIPDATFDTYIDNPETLRRITSYLLSSQRNVVFDKVKGLVEMRHYELQKFIFNSKHGVPLYYDILNGTTLGDLVKRLRFGEIKDTRFYSNESYERYLRYINDNSRLNYNSSQLTTTSQSGTAPQSMPAPEFGDTSNILNILAPRVALFIYHYSELIPFLIESTRNPDIIRIYGSLPLTHGFKVFNDKFRERIIQGYGSNKLTPLDLQNYWSSSTPNSKIQSNSEWITYMMQVQITVIPILILQFFDVTLITSEPLGSSNVRLILSAIGTYIKSYRWSDLNKLSEYTDYWLSMNQNSNDIDIAEYTRGSIELLTSLIFGSVVNPEGPMSYAKFDGYYSSNIMIGYIRETINHYYQSRNLHDHRRWAQFYNDVVSSPEIADVDSDLKRRSIIDIGVSIVGGVLWNYTGVDGNLRPLTEYITNENIPSLPKLDKVTCISTILEAATKSKGYDWIGNLPYDAMEGRIDGGNFMLMMDGELVHSTLRALEMRLRMVRESHYSRI